MASQGDFAEPELARLKNRLDRERRARAESEAIAEKALRELFKKQKEVELLRVIAVAANEASTIEDAMQIALDHVCAHTGWPVGHVYLLAEDSTGELVPTTLWHLENPEQFDTFRKITEATRFPPGVGLPGRVLASGEPAWIMDVTKDANFPRAKQAEDIGVRAAFGFPVLVGTEVVGVLEFFSAEALEPDEPLLGAMANIGTQLGRAIERKRAEEALRESEERYRALGEVGQAVISTLDLQTVLTTIVSHAVQLSGASGGVIYEYDEITQEFLTRATHQVEEELIEALRVAPIRLGEGAVGRAAATRAPVQVPDLLDERAFVVPRARPILARSGYRSLLAVALLIEGRIMGGLVIWRRESGSFSAKVVNLLEAFATQSVLAIQNARLFREIEEKGHQLQIASKHKSQFLANMSHELRTPLNAILGYTELIQDNIYGPVPEKIREVLERLQKSGRHLLGLINDVLDLSKIEAGQLTLSLTDYSMKEVVQAVVTGTESLAAEKKLVLKASVPVDLPPGNGDERRITQVLLNLVGNAIKFTETGEVRVQVTKSDGDFLVSVADTGPGISEADQSKIFEEFHQVDSSSARTKGGTGLGLAITKQIIELHGGRIWVESSPGSGSTFWFTLPVRVE